MERPGDVFLTLLVAASAILPETTFVAPFKIKFTAGCVTWCS